MIRYLFILFICLFATACSSLLPEPDQVRQFILTPIVSVTEATTGQAQIPALSVRAVAVNRFDSDRLLLINEEQELLPYAGVRWSAPLPDLLAETWALSLERAGVTTIARHDASMRGARPAVIVHVREFQGRLDGNGGVLCEVALIVELKGQEESHTGQLNLNAQERALADNAQEVAAAFDRAHRSLIRQGTAWLQEEFVQSGQED